MPAVWSDAVKAGDIRLISNHLAIEGDTATDHAPAINALSAMLETLGGGRLVVGGRGKEGAQFTTGSTIELGHNVSVEGIDSPGGHSANPC